MNQSNNQRYQKTQTLIDEEFLELMKSKRIDQISVAEICRNVHINRSSFYLHYKDIYEMLEQLEYKFAQGVVDIFADQSSEYDGFHKKLCRVFQYLYDHREFYQIYLQGHFTISSFDVTKNPRMIQVMEHMEQEIGFCVVDGIPYHTEFFFAGLGSVVRTWIENGCKQTPMQLTEIIYEEYQLREKGLFQKRTRMNP